MNVLTHEEFKPWKELAKWLWDEVHYLKTQLSEWITFEEAVKLTGRSRAWFYMHRTAGTLPIAMRPRTEGSRRVMFSRADCEQYGRDNDILPPTSTPPFPLEV